MLMVVMCAHRMLAQEIPVVNMPNVPTDNIFLVMFRQVVSNPASMLHCVILCIVAWLIDSTTWINSRYIPHVTIIIGACTYWLYAGSATVAHCYPYPSVVLASNGIISGLFAYGGHRQLIARLICFSRQRSGNMQVLNQQNKAETT